MHILYMDGWMDGWMRGGVTPCRHYAYVMIQYDWTVYLLQCPKFDKKINLPRFLRGPVIIFWTYPVKFELALKKQHHFCWPRGTWLGYTGPSGHSMGGGLGVTRPLPLCPPPQINPSHAPDSNHPPSLPTCGCHPGRSPTPLVALLGTTCSWYG